MSERLAGGEVSQLFRWPVKSMGGCEMREVEVEPGGVLGDRAHAVYDLFRGQPRRLTARQAPRLLDWRAEYDRPVIAGQPVPAARVIAPDGTPYRWGDPELGQALSEDLGCAVTLASGQLMQDLPSSVLITTQASHEAVQHQLGQLSLARWRTNLHLSLDASPFAESDWEGAQLHLGSARFALLHPCRRCVIPTRNPGDDQLPQRWPELLRWLAKEQNTLFGINARALDQAIVRVGDPVEVVRG